MEMNHPRSALPGVGHWADSEEGQWQMPLEGLRARSGGYCSSGVAGSGGGSDHIR